jgi:hypothetical protein
MDSKYQLFIDLDGVLVDFDNGVRRITGRHPSEMEPRSMWPILAKSKGFYDRLDWLDGGRVLWEAVKDTGPAILTGLPLGRWADPQKRSWCRRELGPDIPVISGMSRDKPRLASQWLEDEERTHLQPVLVDDRLKIKEPWEAEGGIFVLHLDIQRTLAELKEVGIVS